MSCPFDVKEAVFSSGDGVRIHFAIVDVDPAREEPVRRVDLMIDADRELVPVDRLRWNGLEVVAPLFGMGNVSQNRQRLWRESAMDRSR